MTALLSALPPDDGQDPEAISEALAEVLIGSHRLKAKPSRFRLLPGQEWPDLAECKASGLHGSMAALRVNVMPVLAHPHHDNPLSQLSDQELLEDPLALDDGLHRVRVADELGIDIDTLVLRKPPTENQRA